MSIQIYNGQTGLTRIDKRQHKIYWAFVQPLCPVEGDCALMDITQMVTVTVPPLLWEPMLEVWVL